VDPIAAEISAKIKKISKILSRKIIILEISDTLLES